MSPDPELVWRAVNGDADATEQLLAEIRPLVLHYCLKRLGTYPAGRELAEDTAQEICLGVLSGLPEFKDAEGAPFTAWVYRIAAFKVIDARRAYAVRSGVHHDPVELHEIADTAVGPVEQVIQAEREAHDAALLSRLIARVLPVHQQMIRLKLEGHTADQIGRRFGLKANAVRQAQHRALEALRRQVG